MEDAWNWSIDRSYFNNNVDLKHKPNLYLFFSYFYFCFNFRLATRVWDRADEPMARVPNKARRQVSFVRNIHCSALLIVICPTRISVLWIMCVCIHVGYSESKYRLRISLAHPRDCQFAHVQWLPVSIEQPKTPFREIRVMFMFVPVR